MVIVSTVQLQPWLAKKGVELDDQDAMTHFGYGRALLARKGYEDALAELESAAELTPRWRSRTVALAIR